MNNRLWRILIWIYFVVTLLNLGVYYYGGYYSLRYTGVIGWYEDDGRVKISKNVDNNEAAAVLRDGDQLVALNGEPYVPNGDQWDKTLNRAPAATVYTITVRRDDEGARVFTLRTMPTPLSRWFNTLSDLPFTVLTFFIGLALFALRSDNKQALLLSLFLVGLAGGFYPPSELKEWSWLLYVVLLINRAVNVLFLAVFLHLCLVFPERSRLLQKFPRLEWLPYILCLLLIYPYNLAELWAYLTMSPSGIRVFYNHPVGTIRALGYLDTVGFILLPMSGVASLLINYRRASQTARRKMRVVLLGTAVGITVPIASVLLLNALEYYNPGLSDRFPILYWIINPLFSFCFLLIPLSFTYAIVRHQVIPVSLIIRRGVRYLLVSRGSIALEFAVVFLAMLVFLGGFFRYMQTSSTLAVGVVSGVFAIIVWNLVSVFNRRLVAPIIDRRFFREAYDAHAVLSDLGQEVRRVTSVEHLLELVAAKIEQALHTRNVMIFLPDEEKGEYKCALSSEYDERIHASVASQTVPSLPSDAVAIGKLREASEPVAVDFTDPYSWTQYLSRSSADSNVTAAVGRERQTLEAISSALLLPLAAKNRMLGFVSLGARLGDLPFSGEDERLLMSVAAQTSLALDNAQLVERMIVEERLRREAEAENEQRAKELEEAKQLQLSMLPKQLPQLSNLEIAAYMKTATEVGGDYYDFHVGEDGTLTVAVGDATGHGLKAGTLVSATKSLFNAFAGNNDIPDTFTRISQALKKMNLRGLFMAMTMLKVKDNQVVLSSAGMPPALIYRNENGQVEEIAIRAMPLGSVAKFPYRQENVSLAADDTIVLMSDGFPEMFNESGEMLADETAKSVLRETGGKSPQEIIKRFVEVGELWAGTRPPDDDVTFVVLKVKSENDKDL